MNKFWTKKEIKLMLNLWEEMSVEDIAEKLGRNRSQIMSMAREIRKSGYNLPKKKIKTLKRSMIDEVLKEMNLL